ncbi:MAG: tRNA uridine-5-carboxymethylaminomethyl(34) synthesis GTPase MnmE, partial [Rhodospirillales bacterium]|nr:tRNA uridine-5-carboxymethylaminomethyl(34) synthesis GTPase MnmE [Rhodospirillales bacterium]
AGSAQLPELAAEDLRSAADELGRITGRIDIEDMLDAIFLDFCIGK